ncbi:MAG TPA: glycosyltransferase [bacterium]
MILPAIEGLLRKMPDFVPENMAESIRGRAKVMPLGLPASLFSTETDDYQGNDERTPPTDSHSPPTVLWNHRWEYDKNPDEFFEVLFDLDRAGVEFRLIVAGENFRTAPAIFEAAREVLAGKIDHFGYVAHCGEYEKLLMRSDIVVSTARHEFYGLSVLEAMAARCYPLLPNRLSYPELISFRYHGQYLYQNTAELRGKLIDLGKNDIPHGINLFKRDSR